MTNTELLAKLKAEIDKLYGEYKDKFHQYGDQYHLGLIDGLDMAERVLDSLESEKPMNQDEELNEEIKRFVAEYGYERSEDILLIAIVARHFAQWQKVQMMKDAVKWLVDDDYDTQTDKGRFILGSVGIGYNGYYIPYSDLLKLPKEDGK